MWKAFKVTIGILFAFYLVGLTFAGLIALLAYFVQ